MSQFAIQLDSISKFYRQGVFKPLRQVLHDVSLQVQTGEAFGFVGPNGAGKSTSIKILMGLIPPAHGHAKLFGLPVTDADSRLGVGYVPENPLLYDLLTPYETLAAVLTFHRKKVGNVRQHCMRTLERLSLADVADRPLRSFSKGMVQRTALAQALVIEPRLLVLDEPLSGLDPIGRRDVVDILMDYRQQGGTVFFSSHVLHDVERLADRFGLIHKGVLRTVQSPHDLVGGDQTLVVRSLGEAAVAGMKADVGGRWFGEVSQSQLWALLELLRAAKHQIIEVKPALSLEKAFLRAVEGPVA